MGVSIPIRRLLRAPVKSIQAAIRWKRLKFDEAPPVFGNAKPKSGSHLLLQILNGYSEIMPYRFVEAAPIRSVTREGRRRSQPEIQMDLDRLPTGVIGWGYLDPTPENIAFLCRPGRVNYFIYRDPRDLLISQVFFATDMHEEHGMHAFYRSLPDFSARLKAAITGVDQDGVKMVSVKHRYQAVFQWLKQKEVLCVRYEDLINNRRATLEGMLDEVERTGYRIPSSRQECLAVLSERIQPKKSRTFRSGKTGDWREYFSNDHKNLFKEVAGDLLVHLGYEKNNEW